MPLNAPFNIGAVAVLRLAKLLEVNTNAPAIWAASAGFPMYVAAEATGETWEKRDELSEELLSLVNSLGKVTVSDARSASPFVAVGPIARDSESFLEIKKQAVDKSLEDRIHALSLLEDGWLDGEGFAIPRSSVEWLIENLARLVFYERPGLSPTPEGNIAAEWSNKSWEASAEIDLRSRNLSWHALNVADGREEDVSFQLDTSVEWTRLQELANEFSSRNE
jgi:hypothetical protein